MLADLSGLLQRSLVLHGKSKRKEERDERRWPRKEKNRLCMDERKLQTHG
jgi:hypothetical protein